MNTGANAKNIRRFRKLKDELEKVLSNYHKNSLDSIAAIKHLLDLATEFQQDDIRTKQLGLTEDELAFYDLCLAAKRSSMKPAQFRIWCIR